MKKWFIERAKERSTWLGITSILTAAGMGLNPAMIETIITAGVAVGGLIATITKDEHK